MQHTAVAVQYVFDGVPSRVMIMLRSHMLVIISSRHDKMCILHDQMHPKAVISSTGASLCWYLLGVPKAKTCHAGQGSHHILAKAGDYLAFGGQVSPAFAHEDRH